MTKEEAHLSVMGAISMALKDPILQQGFEIICKENADLKKQNEELKEFYENGLMIETEKGEQIRIYLPVVVCKCKSESIIKEDIEAGNSPFDADEVFHKEMKTYSDETLGISDIHKYSHKLFEAFEKLEFRTTFNKAIQAFYLERGLYVVRSHSMGKYQYTLVEASSEEMAIRKCF